MSKADLDEWITVAQAAEIRGIHRNSILKALKRKQRPLAGKKVGGRWLLRRDDVVGWQPVGHRMKKEDQPVRGRGRRKREEP